MKLDKRSHYLGKLCPHKHEHNNTGKSLRYIKSKRCVKCMKEDKQRWLSKQSENRLKKRELEREARYEASLHCIFFYECLDIASHAKRGGGKMRCYQCTKMIKEKDHYKKRMAQSECRGDYTDDTELSVII